MSRRKRPAHGGPHKYKRIVWKTRTTNEPYIIFKCMLPGCMHYVQRELVVGNESICWKCGNAFQMSMSSTYLAKPHCPHCVEGKKGEASIKDIAANLDKILGGGGL
jgi:hypothetical protein